MRRGRPWVACAALLRIGLRGGDNPLSGTLASCGEQTPNDSRSILAWRDGRLSVSDDWCFNRCSYMWAAAARTS